MVKKRDNDCSAFVIACYSDPGLHAAREITTKPVLGIAECGILTALTLGQRFGVISILRKSIPRHLRYVGQMGLNDRMAGDRAIGLGVVELANEARTFARMAEVAAELRDEDGADVLVMGCAGMARYRDRLQRHVGLPVVEPSQAAVSMAIGRSRLGWSIRTRRPTRRWCGGSSRKRWAAVPRSDRCARGARSRTKLHPLILDAPSSRLRQRRDGASGLPCLR